MVDDDPATIELLATVAEDAGWVALGFNCLRDLHSALGRRRPTLLILDDDLPDGRGGDRAREFREDARMRDVPVLVCTGAHPLRQAEIGAWAPVMAKPFDLGELDRFLDAAARQQGDSFRRAAG